MVSVGINKSLLRDSRLPVDVKRSGAIVIACHCGQNWGIHQLMKFSVKWSFIDTDEIKVMECFASL
jgi:hypothetical protein